MSPANVKIGFLAVLMAFSCANTLAQSARSASISGVLVSSPGGMAAVNAQVLVRGSKSTLSDSSGRYRIEGIKPGKHLVIFSHLNFDGDSVRIDLAAGQHLVLDLQLTEKVSALQEIEITAKTESRELRDKPFHVEVIDVQPLQQKNLDLNKVLTQSSGIRVRQNAGLGSSFDLTLNGFKAAQFINGIPVEIYGTAYSFNSIPINQINRIEIFKGVVPVHLGGDALGGAINIITKKTYQNNLNLAYSIGSFNTHRASVQGTYANPTTGLTVIGSAFFNRSDNNYVMKDMEIISGTTSYKKDVKRFHDDFLSYAAKAEVGFTNKTFADAILLGVGVSGIKRDIQTGSTQYPPIGEATGNEENQQISLRYSKHDLNEKIDLDAFILVSNTNTVFVDTASRVYQWDGAVLVQRPPTSTSGEFEDKQIYTTLQRDIAQRYNIAYRITAQQALTLNIIHNYSHRGNTDAGTIEGSTVKDNSSQYSKMIIGLGHDLKLWNDKFQSIAFVKYYHMNASIDSAARWRAGYFDRAPLETTKAFWGAGLGISYAFSERFLSKISAEYACRLPSVHELLGDGITTVANVGLKPELSMNYNVGFTARLINRSRITLTFDGAGFYRQAENFIRATTGVRRSTYINFDAALVRGVESEVKLMIAKKFSFRANGSYQQVLDDNAFVGGTLPNYSYRIQLPNTPSLFANADVAYKVTGLLKNRINIVPYYNLLYVRKFYLGYENIARGDLKFTIPMQLVHDLGLTVSNLSEKYSLSFECSNLTNALAFDNFRLQKAGRAFNLKITYNIN